MGYHDGSPGNTGGTMRPDPADINVDMQQFASGTDVNVDGSTPALGSWHLSWIDLGDWFKCTIHVNTAGQYNISTYQAVAGTPNSQTISFNDGTPITISNLAATSTPAGHEIWHNWGTFPNVATVTLDTGLCVLKWTFTSASFNFDKIILTLKTQTGTSSPVANAHPSYAMRANTGKSLLSVSYNLPVAGKIQVSITDCNGKTVSAPLAQNRAAGAQIQTLPIAGLCPGVYFVRLSHNGISTESRFIVAR